MKIRSVSVNRRRRSIDITTAKGELSLPFARLELKPTAKNGITRIYVDKELASECITYSLENGDESSVPLDAFLDYNRDPDYLREMALHELTVAAIESLKKAKLSKNEIGRRLKTSPSQLARLLDTTNRSKSVDEMIRLLTVLGCRVEWHVVRAVA